MKMKHVDEDEESMRMRAMETNNEAGGDCGAAEGLKFIVKNKRLEKFWMMHIESIRSMRKGKERKGLGKGDISTKRNYNFCDTMTTCDPRL